MTMATAPNFGGRSEEALPWIRKALEEKPTWMAAHRNLIVALWLVGRHDEAKDAAHKFYEMFPGFSVHRWVETSPLSGTPGQQRYCDALREAGLPE